MKTNKINVNNELNDDLQLNIIGSFSKGKINIEFPNNQRELTIEEELNLIVGSLNFLLKKVGKGTNIGRGIINFIKTEFLENDTPYLGNEDFKEIILASKLSKTEPLKTKILYPKTQEPLTLDESLAIVTSALSVLIRCAPQIGYKDYEIIDLVIKTLQANFIDTKGDWGVNKEYFNKNENK